MTRRIAVLLGSLVFAALTALTLGACADDGTSCADKSVELAALCAPGCDWELMQEDSAECGLNGIFNPFGGGSAGGRCETSGSCGFICSVNTDLCPFGVSSITRDAYVCAQEGACSEEGAIQCNNGLVSVCSGGSWSNPEACPDPNDVCDLADDMTLGCVPGEVFELPKYTPPASSDSGTTEAAGFDDSCGNFWEDGFCNEGCCQDEGNESSGCSPCEG